MSKDKVRLVLGQAVLSLVVFSLCLSSTGCGAKVGNVKGKITYKDKPLPQGQITFWAADGTAIQGVIRNGMYEVKKVPVGEAKISIHSMDDAKLVEMAKEISKKSRSKEGEGIEQMKNESRPNMQTPKSLIPDKYTDQKSSGLSTTINGGDNEYNIDLK